MSSSKLSVKSDDDKLPSPPSNDAANDGFFNRLLPWQKRTMSGVTESRADSKITDSPIHQSSGGGGGNNFGGGVGAGTDGGGDSGNHDTSDVAPRLVLRNLPYGQSYNNIQVRHNYTAMKLYKLIQHDWFHVLLRFPTSQSLLFLISIWTLFLVIWAGCYVWVDRSNIGVECGLGPNGSSISFRGAFAFSLQTCTTGRWL